MAPMRLIPANELAWYGESVWLRCGVSLKRWHTLGGESLVPAFCRSWWRETMFALVDNRTSQPKILHFSMLSDIIRSARLIRTRADMRYFNWHVLSSIFLLCRHHLRDGGVHNFWDPGFFMGTSRMSTEGSLWGRWGAPEAYWGAHMQKKGAYESRRGVSIVVPRSRIAWLG